MERSQVDTDKAAQISVGSQTSKAYDKAWVIYKQQVQQIINYMAWQMICLDNVFLEKMFSLRSASSYSSNYRSHVKPEID